jgi:hypothetical protein
MRLWAVYAGELAKLTAESGMALNDSLINRPIDPSGIAQLVNLYNSKLLSGQTVLAELQRGGILDPDMKIKEEMNRISKEEAASSGGSDSLPPIRTANNRTQVAEPPARNP